MSTRPTRHKEGFLISFEGIEGSGKTTQIHRLAGWFKKQGYRVLLTREPGGTPFADRVRRILLHPKNRGLTPLLELLLYEVARRDHVEKVIRPALSLGKIVLCDRFTDATLAYQGAGRRLSIAMIEEMNRLATGGLQPDLTILLDLAAPTGLRRSRNRLRQGGPPEGRLEGEPIRWHEQVRQGYRDLARRERRRFVVVDAAGNPNPVFEAIKDRVQRTWNG